MANLKLVVGNRNYASWSLRAYLALARCTDDFELVVVPLFEDGYKERLNALSPSGQVPALDHDGLTIWDSLAIAEYLAERFPAAGLWPAEPAARALARAAAAEMHGGFRALRQGMPMNVRARFPDRGRTPAALADVDRLTARWRGLRARWGTDGPFLFGAFSIADCFYAPVVTRLRTYEVDVDDDSRAYMEAIEALPAMQHWVEEARREPWRIPAYD